MRARLAGEDSGDEAMVLVSSCEEVRDTTAGKWTGAEQDVARLMTAETLELLLVAAYG